MPPISPCLWFDDDLEEAVAFYTSVFPDSEVLHVSRYGEAGPGKAGTVMAAEWTANGQRFKGINGGPEHAGFTETISFSVDCADQAEVDRYWEALTADGGEESMCGWLKDRFGSVLADRPGAALRADQRPRPRPRSGGGRRDALDATDRGGRPRGSRCRRTRIVSQRSLRGVKSSGSLSIR